VAGLALAAAFAFAHVLGLREQTRFLSGTPAWVFPGALYALLYFATVLIVPPLLAAAFLLAALERIFRAGEDGPVSPIPPETTR
jgi:hypothetical protein